MDNLQYCDICEVTFTSPVNQQEHQNSPAHKKKVRQEINCDSLYKSVNNLPPTTESDDVVSVDEYMLAVDKNQYFCRLCKVNCAGKIPAFNHIKGKPHRQKMKKLKFDPEMASLDFLTASTPPMSSLLSAPHELQGTSFSPTDLPDLEVNRLTGHFYCKICKLSMSGEVPAKAHLQGKSHLKKLRITREMGHFTDEISDRLSNISISDSQTAGRSSVGASGDASDKFFKGDKDPASTDNDMIQNETGGDGLHGHSVGGAENAQSGEDRAENGNEKNGMACNLISGETEIKMETFDEDLVRDKDGWTCGICSVPLNSEKTVKQHFVGKAHLKRKKVMSLSKGQCDSGEELPQYVEILPETGHFKCSLCDVSMTSEGPLNEHLSGKAHLKKQQVKGRFLQSINSPGDPGRSPNSWMVSSSIVNQKNCREMGTEQDGISAGNVNQSSQSSITGTAIQPHSPVNILDHNNKAFNPMTSPPIVPSFKQNDHCLDKISGKSSQILNARQNQQQPNHPYPKSPGDPILRKQSPPRPPPGFEGHGKPMADFLDHQRIASETQPSHMHNFWSMSSQGQDFPDGGMLQESPVNRATQIAPIGTPDPLNTEFTLDLRTMRYMCNTCQIEVTGKENARCHLSGSKHAKKVKVKQFQEKHMSPYLSNSMSIASPLAVQNQQQMAAAYQPTVDTPLTQSDQLQSSSIQVLSHEGGSSSFEYRTSGSSGSYDYTTTANNNQIPGSGVAPGHTVALDDGPMPLRGVSLYGNN